jgi:hypothetical protein
LNSWLQVSSVQFASPSQFHALHKIATLPP